MFPMLIDLGTHDLPFLGETPIFLPTYGVLYATAVILAWAWFSHRAKGMDIGPDLRFNLCFYTLLAGILGAKLLLIVLDWRVYLQHPGEIFGTLRSAGVLAGGVIAGAVTFVLYSRRHGLPTWRLADAIAAPLVLAQSVGRLGCFSAGCCWGVGVSPDAAFSSTFTDPVAHAQTGVPLNLPLAPVQLIEMGADLFLVAVLTLLWRRRPEPPGTVFWLYLLLYSTARGVIEFWRGDVHRGMYFGNQVSTSQLFAMAAALLALVMLVRGLRSRQAISSP